jgi:hypothetical protein
MCSLLKFHAQEQVQQQRQQQQQQWQQLLEYR